MRDVEPLTPNPPSPEEREKAWEIGRPLTPRSESRRRAWGSLIMCVSLQGLCGNGPCLKKANHDGPCWPERS